ncbi:UNVERIFIED_CONTAM: hypothetical protein NCL1_61740 [Trichonephila clavipes]
MYDHME